MTHNSTWTYTLPHTHTHTANNVVKKCKNGTTIRKVNGARERGGKKIDFRLRTEQFFFLLLLCSYEQITGELKQNLVGKKKKIFFTIAVLVAFSFNLGNKGKKRKKKTHTHSDTHTVTHTHTHTHSDKKVMHSSFFFFFAFFLLI